MNWRKSSFSASQTNCVEVAWRKSSFSADQTNCVELGWRTDGVAVRDSKNPAGPVLLLDMGAHSALIAALGVAAIGRG